MRNLYNTIAPPSRSNQATKVDPVEIETNLVPPVPRVYCKVSLPRISGSCFENLEIHNSIGKYFSPVLETSKSRSLPDLCVLVRAVIFSILSTTYIQSWIRDSALDLSPTPRHCSVFMTQLTSRGRKWRLKCILRHGLRGSNRGLRPIWRFRTSCGEEQWLEM